MKNLMGSGDIEILKCPIYKLPWRSPEYPYKVSCQLAQPFGCDLSYQLRSNSLTHGKWVLNDDDDAFTCNAVFCCFFFFCFSLFISLND